MNNLLHLLLGLWLATSDSVVAGNQAKGPVVNRRSQTTSRRTIMYISSASTAFDINIDISGQNNTQLLPSSSWDFYSDATSFSLSTAIAITMSALLQYLGLCICGYYHTTVCVLRIFFSVWYYFYFIPFKILKMMLNFLLYFHFRMEYFRCWSLNFPFIDSPISVWPTGIFPTSSRCSLQVVDMRMRGSYFFNS